MTLSLVLHPDPRLRVAAEPVPEVTDEVVDRLREMLELMRAHGGCGLAAPQVGWSARAFVMEFGRQLPRAFVNPRAWWQGRELAVAGEGCLSIPGRAVQVARPKAVRFTATVVHFGRELAFVEGEQDVRASGWAARCVLHELDHLDGVLVLDREAGR